MPDSSPLRSARTVVVLGFALFAMFFGAGNLIFPPTLGRLAGDHFSWAILGFLLTGVGLPLMGILAVAKAEGGIEHMARRVDSRFAKALSITIMMIIGPLFAIPRTAATTFELGIAPNVPLLGSWAFSFIFFVIVLFFAMNPLSVVDRIGKFLTPLLIGSLAVLIIKGIVQPMSAPAADGVQHAFGKSFVEGYQTMDMLASVIFGIIILNALRSKGITQKGSHMSTVVKAGIISAVGLAVIYSGLLYLGATSSVITGNLTRTELVLAIAHRLLGRGGGIILGVAVSMACLTTAIGLTVVCGQYFNKITYGKLSYKTICVVVAGISLVLSNAGVETIIRFAVPVLVALYPVVMVLVVLTLAGRRFGKRGIWRGAVIGAFAFGLLEAVKAVNIKWAPVDLALTYLPFTHHGLGWLLPAVVLGAFGALSRERVVQSFRVLAVCPSQLFTRVAIFDHDEPVFETAISHKFDQHMSGDERSSQVTVIKEELAKRLGEKKIDLSKIDAVTSRGGFLHPLPGGVYRITKEMLIDLEKHAWRHHPSNWGAAIANEIAIAHNFDAFIVDPIVVDEMDEVARASGLPEIKRASIFHASNQKAVVRRVAKHLWKRYDQINAIVAHIGEGTSVGAHREGKVVDVNNALDGDGPFSAINAGSLPTVDIVKMCFENGADQEKVLKRIRSSGGLCAHLGTTDIEEIIQMIRDDNEEAGSVMEAMGYQVSKEIGSLATALGGKIDAIVVTGEFAVCTYLVKYIKSKVCFLAPVFVYPGESETKALVAGTRRALSGEEKVSDYIPLN